MANFDVLNAAGGARRPVVLRVSTRTNTTRFSHNDWYKVQQTGVGQAHMARDGLSNSRTYAAVPMGATDGIVYLSVRLLTRPGGATGHLGASHLHPCTASIATKPVQPVQPVPHHPSRPQNGVSGPVSGTGSAAAGGKPVHRTGPQTPLTGV